ncbi:MAG: hypothetical protein WDW38_002143 [Sanguina aurantia]
MEASAAANLLAGHLQTLAKLLTQAVSILRAGTAGRACFVETSLYTWTADITSAFHTTKDFLSSVEHVSWADLDNAGKRGVAAAKRRLHIEHQLCLTASSSFLATCLRQLQCLDASTSSAADTYVPGRSSSDQGLVTAHEFRAFLAILQAVAVTAGWFALVVEDAVSPCLGRPPNAAAGAIASHLHDSEAYGHEQGLEIARDAIAAQQHARGARHVDADRIFIGNGVSELIDLSLRALLQSDDEVLLPSPDYPLWSAATILNGGRPRYYRCLASHGHLPDPDEVEALITPRTRALVLINPNNPTGAVYPRALLERLVAVAARHKLLLLCDEIYDEILYDEAVFQPLAEVAGELPCISFGGLSKVHRACGYRVGWMSLSGDPTRTVAYRDALQLLAALRLCANVTAQWAVIPALQGAPTIGALTAPGGRLHDARRAVIEGVALGGVEVACVRGLVRCCSLRLMHRMQQQQQQQQQTPAGLEAVVGDDGMDQLQTLMLWLMEACTHSLDIDSDGSPLFYTQHQLWQLTHEQQRQLCQQRHTQSRGVLPALQWCKLHTWRGMAGSSAVLEAVLRFDPPGNNNTTNTSTTTTNNNNNNNSPLLLSALHSVSENLEMQTKRGQPSPPWQAHTSLAATLHKLLHQPLLDGVDATSLVAHLPMCVLYAMKIDFSLRSTLRAIDGYLRQNHTGGHDAAQPGQRHCAPIGEAAPNSRPIDGSASSCPPRHGTAVGGAAHTRAGGDEDQRGARQLFAVLAHSVVRLRIWRMRDTRARMSARTREESAAGLAEDLLGGDANLCEVVDVLQHLASDERHLQDDELATRGHARVWQRYALSHCHGRLLPGCGGPRCNNFAGVSEAALPTRLCGGCRRVRYCSVECQRAAWVEGAHREVCAVS